MKIRNIALIALFLIYGACGYTGSHRYGDANAQDVEVEEFELDAHTTLVVCAAAHIVANDKPGASWFTTIAEDEVQIEFFANLFILGLESGEIASDDVADTIEACANIKALVEAKE